jgi:uncharacterized protein
MLMRQEDNIDGLPLLRGGLAVHPAIKSRGFRSVNLSSPERHWVRDDPFATAFFNALSAVFPRGEAFMISSLLPYQNNVPEPLASDIRGFIEQEAGHSREHIAMNKGLIAAGYDVAPLESAIRKFVATFQKTSNLTKVAATMCIEHITAIVAAEVLKNEHHLDNSNAELKELWLWHAVEEVEHKAVAFDTWMYLTRDWSGVRRWATRSTLMILISATFLYNRSRGQIELLRQDGFSLGQALRGILKSGFGKGGIGRNVTKPWLHFLKPGFHPWNIDDSALILQGEEQLAQAAAKKTKPVERTERRARQRLAKAA